MAEVKELRTARNGKVDESDEEAIRLANETPDDPDLGEAGGRSIEDLAEGGVEDEEGQQLLDFGGRLNLSIKGKKPTDSEIKVKAISTPISGQLGDVGDDEQIRYIGTAMLDDILIRTKRDGDRRVSGKVRRHILTPIAFLPVRNPDHLARLEALIEEIVADAEAGS